jgi:diguanylate cyclase (GGDEF)-like protein
MRRLSEELSRSERFGTAVAVLMIDLDHFKAVNDTHGHQAGDQVLARVSAVLREQTRNEDVMARYGGEEFTAMIWPAEAQTLAAVAERLRSAVEAHPIGVGEVTLRITVSIGGCLHSGAEGSVTPEQMIGLADEALYRAKREGRNRVVITDRAAPAQEPPNQPVRESGA